MGRVCRDSCWVVGSTGRELCRDMGGMGVSLVLFIWYLRLGINEFIKVRQAAVLSLSCCLESPESLAHCHQRFTL